MTYFRGKLSYFEVILPHLSTFLGKEREFLFFFGKKKKFFSLVDYFLSCVNLPAENLFSLRENKSLQVKASVTY